MRPPISAERRAPYETGAGEPAKHSTRNFRPLSPVIRKPGLPGLRGDVPLQPPPQPCKPCFMQYAAREPAQRLKQLLDEGDCDAAVATMLEDDFLNGHLLLVCD